jgi:carboxypeptidase family protein
MTRHLLACIAAVLLLAVPVFAANTGDISGTVIDPSGAVIQGAKVTVKNASTGAIRVAISNEFGQFSVPEIEIGNYSVSVEKTGFKAYSSNVLVRSGENSRISAQLLPGSAGEVIEVEGTTPTLDVATAQISSSLDTVHVQALPNQGRDPVAYATLAPGTVPVTKDNPFLGTGSFNSNGSRGRANNITVDGVISSDVSTTGESGIRTFSYDGVQEFKLISNNFDAEFGRNSGSQVQIITKSGSNAFHGSAYEFYQGDMFNARDFFTPINPATGRPNPPARFVQNQGGFTLGGPLYKNHTFFFGHWELDKTRGSGSPAKAAVMTPAQVAGITDPSSLALFKGAGSPSDPSGVIVSPAPNTNDGHSWSLRIDQNLRGGKDSFFARYGENPSAGTSPGLTFVSSNLPGYGAKVTSASRNLVVGHTLAITTNLINQFHFGFGRNNPNFVPNTTFTLEPQVVIGGIDSFGESQIIPQGRTQNTFQYLDTVAWVRGRHTIKFGGDMTRVQSYSLFDAAFKGVVTYANVAAFQAGTPLSWAQRVGNSVRHNFSLDGSLFVQDDYRLTDAITLNLGFRMETAGGVTEGSNLLSNINPNNTTPIGVIGTGPLGGVDLGGEAFHRNWNPAPRLGMAWNPGRGKLVVRGGYGIAYDYIFLNPITNLRFAAPFIPTLTVSTPSPAQMVNLLAGTDTSQAQAIASVGKFPSTFTNFGSMSAVDQNLENPRNQQWNAGVEYQVSKALTLKTSYVGTKNDHLQVTMPLNFTNPALRPAAATSLADQTARITLFRNFVAGENAGATGTNNRIDPRFNTVTQVQSIGTSNYNAFQIEAIGKFGQWLTFNTNYTYGHSIDDISDVLGVLVNDSANIGSPDKPLSANRANSQFDIRQRFVANYVYQIPFARSMSNGIMKRILDGWSMSGIFSTQTGLPVTLFAGTIQGVSDPLLLGAGTAWVDGDATQLQPGNSAAQVIGKSGLAQPLIGHQGTSGRNHLRLGGVTDLDAAIGKGFQVTEGRSLQLRCEVFNLLNHPNMSGFSNTFTAGNFGQYTRTSTNMRQMQVAARFQF